MSLIAYHNNPQIKADILKQLEAHREADEIVKGQYWENGKGCAVGCTIHSDDHMEYEKRFGIPVHLARLKSVIFEGLPNSKAKDWPIRFMDVFEPGRDYGSVVWNFLHWILTDEKVNHGINHPIVKDEVAQCANLVLTRAQGGCVDVKTIDSAMKAAERAAERAWGEWSARKAAWSAAEIAWSVWKEADRAWSAWEAAESVKSAAKGKAESVKNAAKGKEKGRAYTLMADKLIELIKEVK